ncbi:PRC-barrel domain-containing protein [Pararhodobacter zhoushanensis]|uniref:PRC-barrel domain-containing protein n=1 Tax=Pararhodobacter zhoushanensis TaxID=2479545 RepID=A0ABT3H3V4_9RHOB|nr:PRC-barrel domain-containing protein [Pararhodobacter zhoushanensis]MCW1934477.1 PRC-barrel domain-containing protein [Pararhodobacter zhoushanensis]
MRTNKALLITMMLGLTAGSTAAYAQTMDADTNTDVTIQPEAPAATLPADQATDDATSPLLMTDDNATATTPMDAAPSITTLATAEELVGVRVFDQNEELVGEISAVLPASQTEGEERLVIDVGGFLGIGEKPIAIDATSATASMDDNGDLDFVTVSYTQEELEAMPEVEM